MSLTTDPNDPRLTHGVDPPDATVPQAAAYLVLPHDADWDLVRPVRRSYWHTLCGKVTTMSLGIAETYARNPSFYGATYCVWCQQHRPVGPDGEFYWCDPDDPETQAPARQPKVGT
jgi:hypothetical protein